jgi:hypothetical protein
MFVMVRAMNQPLPERKEHRLQMLIEPSLISRIDRWRAKQPGLPSRSEAVRRLVEAGLIASEGDDDKAPYDPGPRQQVKT